MKVLCSLLFVLISFSISAQLSDLEFGSDDKLEIVTWNLENFPKKGSVTVDSVAVVVQALDVDIIALQEIEDKEDFNALLANLPEYDGFYDPNFFGGLAYIYNESTIEVLDIFEIYTNNNFWNAFPRAPYILEFKFQGKKMYCINNHLKCCGDGTIENNNDDDEEFRRLKASRLLEEYIDEQLPNEHVFLVGDLNDLIAENSSKNVFQPFIDFPSKYKFADLDIALGSFANWSFPNWPSHLDHILITNELYDAFDATDTEVRTIKVDQFLIGGLNQYDNQISDHRPVGIALNAGIVSSAENGILEKTMSVFPNPTADQFHITGTNLQDNISVNLFSSLGSTYSINQINRINNKLSFDISFLPAGMYFVHITNGDIIEVQTLVKR